jgi:hypothetical protein
VAVAGAAVWRNAPRAAVLAGADGAATVGGRNTGPGFEDKGVVGETLEGWSRGRSGQGGQCECGHDGLEVKHGDGGLGEDFVG